MINISVNGREQNTNSKARTLDYLEQLETESIHIFREIAAQFEKPALLFSGGKDSITLVHLARKAFAPGKIPFPLVHIDTGHNFPEALDFRDELAKEVKCNPGGTKSRRYDQAKKPYRAKRKICKPQLAADTYIA